MNKFLQWLQGPFTEKANRLFKRPALAALSAAMQKSIPFILIGSIVFFYNVFKSYLAFLPDLSGIANYSFGLISLVITFMISQQMMEKLEHRQYETTAGLISILSLLLVILGGYEGEEAMNNFLVVAGPSGILMAMVVSMFVSFIFHIYTKLHLLENTVTVPDFCVNWISIIIPSFTTLTILMVLVINMKLDLYIIVMNMFSPFFKLGQSLPGMVLICFLPVFFYTLGVSTWFWEALRNPIFLAGIQANIAAVAAGLPAENIVTNETCIATALLCMGGAGCTLILVVLMLFSKSKKIRAKGRIFIGPSIFNINEPVVFGAPIVYNPILMVPMWICGIVGPVILWFVMRFGWLNIPSGLMQIGQIPLPISSILVTNDMRALLWFVVLFVIYTIIWYPFFKVYEKQVMSEEL